MEFRILGPLEVVHNDRPLPLGSGKQPALLALLLLRANEIVPIGRLIDELWGENPPPTAAKIVQGHVSQLRKLLGRELIRTRAGGYAIAVARDELDLERFRRLLAEGRAARDHADPVTARRLIGEALALWQGSPLSEFDDAPFASAERRRLEELRLTAVEERIDTDLELGRNGDLVSELEALLHDQPYRERLYEQLMRALYRAGRQAEALDVYQRARRILGDELGIEPSPSLRELQAAILRQDASLASPAAHTPSVEGSPEPPPEPTREVRKTVTVLFTDVVSSTELGETADPEAVRRVMTRWYEEMRTVIERHGGTVEKFAGDEVMAVFGVPVVHEDDALRAVRAAAEMRERLDTLNEELEADQGAPLEARIGINTGEVVAGDPATGQTFVTGDAVNLARRLEQAAQPGEILIGKATYALVKDAVRAGPLESFVVRGKREPVTPLRVTGVDLRASGVTRRLDAPMIGRGRELRMLRDAFDRCVSDRRCHLITLLGAAGVGKSRLVQEFVESVSREAVVLGGRCLPYGEAITFWPLAEVVRAAAGLRGDESSPEAHARIAALLDGAENAAPIAEKVAQLVGLSTGVTGVEEGFWAARKLFEALAAERPLVLVFEEMERAESGFLDLVEHVTDISRDRAMLVVCVARPELLEARSGWGGGKLNAASVLLESLGEEDTSRLVGRLVGGEADPAVISTIVEAAEGNPLFAEEYVAMLVEGGLLERRESRWSATIDLAALPVPPTIQALLASRIDQLPAPDRAALERAAVEGKTFHAGAVTSLWSEASRDELERVLTGLVRQELIRPAQPQFVGEDAFRFRHLLIRDAAYESIPKELRADLHEQFASWLQRRAGASATEYEEILGYHIERACRYRDELGRRDERWRDLATKAAALLSSAGRRAEARGDWRAASNLLARAVALHEGGRRRELLPNLIEAVYAVGDIQGAKALAVDAIEEAIASGDRRLEAWTRVQDADLQTVLDPWGSAEKALAEANRALEVFEQLGDHAGLFRAWELVSEVHAGRGEVSAAHEALEHALLEARRSGEQRLEIWAETRLGSLLFHGPTPIDDAISYLERALVRTRAHGDLASTAEVLGRLARLYAARGRFDEARVLHAESESLAAELGVQIYSQAQLAQIEVLAGNPSAAEGLLRTQLEALRAAGDTAMFATYAALLGDVLCTQGRYDDAERYSREAEEAAASDVLRSQVAWRVVRARVFAARGELDRAESFAREALALAGSGEFVHAHASALVCLAEVLREAGRRDEAAAFAEEARAIWERKGNVVMEAKARALLTELIPEPPAKASQLARGEGAR